VGIRPVYAVLADEGVFDVRFMTWRLVIIQVCYVVRSASVFMVNIPSPRALKIIFPFILVKF